MHNRAPRNDFPIIPLITPGKPGEAPGTTYFLLADGVEYLLLTDGSNLSLNR